MGKDFDTMKNKANGIVLLGSPAFLHILLGMARLQCPGHSFTCHFTGLFMQLETLTGEVTDLLGTKIRLAYCLL